MSFLPHYFHSFRITVIPSGLLSFLPYPAFLKVYDSQGYLWLPYDLTKVVKLFGVTFKQSQNLFSNKYFMSFLLPYCHSFRITVIPSRLLSFLPYPTLLKLYDSQGYLWLPYDLTKVIKLIGETFEPQKYIFFQKNTL